MRRRSASCSATARRAPSSPCCWPNARKAVSTSGSVRPSRIFPAQTASGWRPARAASPPPALVLATGGLSIPKMGATGFAYDVARRFGLGVTEPLPGLVPLKATPEALGFDQLLAGVSLEAIVSCAGQSFRENILFTHRGLSGPAILQISSYWRQGDTIVARPGAGVPTRTPFWSSASTHVPGPKPKTVLAEILPARLAHALAEACLPPGPMANVSDRTLAAFAARLKRWEFNRQVRRAGPRPR